MNVQVLSSGHGNPNGYVLPQNMQLAAIYYTPQSTGYTAQWCWDVQAQTWKLFTPQQQIYGGAMTAGTLPTISPLNPLLPALFTNWTDGVLSYWRPDTGTWN